MKTIVISDIHGMAFWKEIIAKADPKDKIVFLGDYFDQRSSGPFAESQKDNFLEICALARNNPNVHLLLGNHDFQYTSFTDFHMSSYDKQNGQDFNKALMYNMDLLKIVHIDRKKEKPVLFSHAGVSRTFMDNNQLSSPEEINSLFQSQPWKFEFIVYFNGTLADRYGDNCWQSPLWIRPESLLQDALAGYEQVVGHTPVKDILEIKSANNDKIYFTCTMDTNCLELK